MLEILKEEKVSITGGVVMRGGSGGPVSNDVIEWFLNKIISKLKNQRVDGVLVALHGATTSDKSDDVCGEDFGICRNADNSNCA